MPHKAYLAGLIDGEGTIRIQKPARASQYVPMVRITSVVLEPLEFAKGFYGGWIRKYQPISSKGSANCRLAYEWSVQGRQNVLTLITDIQPYAIIKRKHVELMREFIEAGEVSKPPVPVSPDEILRRQRIFEMFGQLNKRGIA